MTQHSRSWSLSTCSTANQGVKAAATPQPQIPRLEVVCEWSDWNHMPLAVENTCHSRGCSIRECQIFVFSDLWGSDSGACHFKPRADLRAWGLTTCGGRRGGVVPLIEKPPLRPPRVRSGLQSHLCSLCPAPSQQIPGLEGTREAAPGPASH